MLRKMAEAWGGDRIDIIAVFACSGLMTALRPQCERGLVDGVSSEERRRI